MSTPEDYLKVGIIYNKSKGVPLDMIAVKFSSSKKGHGIEFNCRVDEALGLITGLGKVLLYSSWGIGKSGILLKKYMDKYLTNENLPLDEDLKGGDKI